MKIAISRTNYSLRLRDDFLPNKSTWVVFDTHRNGYTTYTQWLVDNTVYLYYI